MLSFQFIGFSQEERLFLILDDVAISQFCALHSSYLILFSSVLGLEGRRESVDVEHGVDAGCKVLSTPVSCLLFMVFRCGCALYFTYTLSQPYCVANKIIEFTLMELRHQMVSCGIKGL